jgi:hypothetical protein
MPLESVELESSPTEDVLPLTAEESISPEEEPMPEELLTSEELEPPELEPSLLTLLLEASEVSTSTDVEDTVLVSVREIVTEIPIVQEVLSASRETDTLESVDAVEEEEETGITVSVPLTGTELWLTAEESTTPDAELMPEEWLTSEDSVPTEEESTSPDVEELLYSPDAELMLEEWLTAEESTSPDAEELP